MSVLEPPAISRLSEELVAFIVDYVLYQHGETDDHDLRSLKSLRLTDPRFARSSSIQRILFSKICLSARYTRRDLRAYMGIAPSVKAISFESMHCVPLEGLRDNPLDHGYWARQTKVWAAAKGYVSSGRAESDWVEVLRAASNLTTISILAPQRPLVRRRAAQEKAETVPGKGELLPLALKCLSRAGTKPRRLLLHESDAVSYIGQRDWAMVDLSLIEHLDFRLQNDATELLSMCITSLKCLKIGPIPRMYFPLGRFPVLPALEDLPLHEVWIDPSEFAVSIGMCSKLVRLSFHQVQLTGRQFLRDWRPIFDAIRSHDNRMEFSCVDSLTITEKDALAIHHHTSRAPMEKSHNTVDDYVAYEIEKYISGIGEWSLKEYEGLL